MKHLVSYFYTGKCTSPKQTAYHSQKPYNACLLHPLFFQNFSSFYYICTLRIFLAIYFLQYLFSIYVVTLPFYSILVLSHLSNKFSFFFLGNLFYNTTEYLFEFLFYILAFGNQILYNRNIRNLLYSIINHIAGSQVFLYTIRYRFTNDIIRIHYNQKEGQDEVDPYRRLASWKKY